MLVRMDGWSAALTVCRELLWRLGIFLFFVLRVLGQASQTEVPNAAAEGAAKVAAPSASAAMQESVLRQTMAVQAGQQKAQKGSLSQQRASLRLQHQDTIAGVPQAPVGTPVSSPASFSGDFFSTQWEPAPPATMPNVRIPTTACPALADEEVDKLINLAAVKNAISAGLIRAVMKQESAFRP
jgi:soluble lytic murein transglycosylase-like protein